MASSGTTNGRRKSIHGQMAEVSTNAQRHQGGARTELPPETKSGPEKLGTVSGVFVPTTLNVLSILMFLRFGFILGQSGFLGMMGKFDHLLTFSLFHRVT